MRYWYY